MCQVRNFGGLNPAPFEVVFIIIKQLMSFLFHLCLLQGLVLIAWSSPDKALEGEEECLSATHSVKPMKPMKMIIGLMCRTFISVILENLFEIPIQNLKGLTKISGRGYLQGCKARFPPSKPIVLSMDELYKG